MNTIEIFLETKQDLKILLALGVLPLDQIEQ